MSWKEIAKSAPPILQIPPLRLVMVRWPKGGKKELARSDACLKRTYANRGVLPIVVLPSSRDCDERSLLKTFKALSMVLPPKIDFFDKTITAFVSSLRLRFQTISNYELK
jgi:hypothetical protein